MPNPRPNTSGLKPLDSERARELASRPRKSSVAEPTVKTQVVLFERQQKALEALGENRSALIRRLLDEWLAQQP